MLSCLFRDNGIVISTSVIQWILEMIHLMIYQTFVYIIHGYSTTSDKFFNLYFFSFVLIIQPIFYLHGDWTFRKNLDQRGLFYALRFALFNKNWTLKILRYPCFCSAPLRSWSSVLISLLLIYIFEYLSING